MLAKLGPQLTLLRHHNRRIFVAVICLIHSQLGSHHVVPADLLLAMNWHLKGQIHALSFIQLLVFLLFHHFLEETVFTLKLFSALFIIFLRVASLIAGEIGFVQATVVSDYIDLLL